MFRWYAINTYSGHENKVKANLEHRIDSMAQQPRFRRVVVPTEQIVETRDLVQPVDRPVVESFGERPVDQRGVLAGLGDVQPHAGTNSRRNATRNSAGSASRGIGITSC